MRRIALAASLVLAAGCERELPPFAHTGVVPPEPSFGRIVFVSERDGDRALYSTRADGSGLERLSEPGSDDYAAPPGPRGEILALSVAPGEERVRWRAPSSWQPIGAAAALLRNPAWLPDGRALVVERGGESFRDLYLVDRWTGISERLTRSDSGCFEPAVSPDGERVAYVSTDDSDPEIHMMHLPTRAVARLTWSRGEDSAPAWSPDGEAIAFVSARSGLPRIYLMDADGALPRPLLPRIEPAAVGAGAPAWSPDGDAIAFVEGRSGQLLLRVVRVADGATLALVEGDMPAWSPDGRHIAFVSQSDDQDRDIHMMRRDGVARRRLTDHPADDWLPRWTVHAPPHHP